MKKINISICTNKDCYIKGTALFKQLDAIMCATLKSRTTMAGSECPGYCLKTGTSQAPCANVNGRLIKKANPREIIQAIRECPTRV
jgi:NADH:ubiquinone oxidoreductase subunit E